MSNNITPMVCKVYQTGTARQYHYTKTIEPVVTFNQVVEIKQMNESEEQSQEQSQEQAHGNQEANLLDM